MSLVQLFVSGLGDSVNREKDKGCEEKMEGGSGGGTDRDREGREKEGERNRETSIFYE